MLLAHNNRRLAPDVDTVFFMTSIEHSYVASSLVKEIATFGGDVSAMIPPRGAAALAGRSASADDAGPGGEGAVARRRPARSSRRAGWSSASRM